jgi:hypothetical protein
MQRLLKGLLGAAFTVTTAVLATTAQAAEFECQRGGLATHVQVITLDGVQTTSSTTPVNLRGATFHYLSTANCLVVEVTGQARAASPHALRLRLVVAGNVDTGPFPNTRDVYTDSTAFDGRSATFFVNLLSGNKTLRVQFMSADGTPVSLNKGLIVIHFERAGT